MDGDGVPSGKSLRPSSSLEWGAWKNRFLPHCLSKKGSFAEVLADVLATGRSYSTLVLFSWVLICPVQRKVWAMACSHAQLCPTLGDSRDCSPPGSAVRGILQARILEWVASPPLGSLLHPGMDPESPALAGRFFTTGPLGKPI